jgi:hypothetical protein
MCISRVRASTCSKSGWGIEIAVLTFAIGYTILSTVSIKERYIGVNKRKTMEQNAMSLLEAIPTRRHPALRIFVTTAEYMLAMHLMALRVGPGSDGGKDFKGTFRAPSRAFPRRSVPALGVERHRVAWTSAAGWERVGAPGEVQDGSHVAGRLLREQSPSSR